jgi:predicted enzyme related to lactoylglutathione lyase
MSVLINIDVPDLSEAEKFYTSVFGLTVSRRFGEGVAELIGWPSPVYLLENFAGTRAAAGAHRSYARHWTPVHLDVVVDDLDAAMARASAAGAIVERGPRKEIWGRIAGLADPFGHGLCLIQFLNRGYDEIATPVGKG